jgi:hypothetical protein
LQQPFALAAGYQAGQTNQQGSAIAIGYQAGQQNQQASSVAIGYQAGQSNQQGFGVAIGYQAGLYTQGTYSIAIGYRAGYTGQPPNSIVINASGVGITGATGSCYVAPIRSVTAGSSQGNILVYDSVNKEIQSASTLTFSGSIAASSYFSTSDVRLKTNIQSFPSVLEKVKRLEPVQFDWKLSGKPDYGFIAQQFYREFDFLSEAHDYLGDESPAQYYSMEYSKITAILCKALQEMEEKNEDFRISVEKRLLGLESSFLEKIGI